MVKSRKELEFMRQSGQVTAQVLKSLIEAALPGVNLLDLEALANQELEKLGAKASFRSVPEYHFATCLNVNSEVVHGIPRNIILKTGDILKIDFGAELNGWHTDAAWSIRVGETTDYSPQTTAKPAVVSSQSAVDSFLKTGEEAMWAGIKAAKVGNKIGDISAAIQETIEKAGFNVVRSLCGHGVGKSGHEDPEVPTFGKSGTGINLEAGMTLAIEAIYCQGQGEVVTLDDGWTIASEDGSLAGLFEMTVIVGEAPEVITDWRRL